MTSPSHPAGFHAKGRIRAHHLCTVSDTVLLWDTVWQMILPAWKKSDRIHIALVERFVGKISLKLNQAVKANNSSVLAPPEKDLKASGIWQIQIKPSS